MGKDRRERSAKTPGQRTAFVQLVSDKYHDPGKSKWILDKWFDGRFPNGARRLRRDLGQRRDLTISRAKRRLCRRRMERPQSSRDRPRRNTRTENTTRRVRH